MTTAPASHYCGGMSEASDPHAFEFDLDRGIREQVVRQLEASPELALSRNVAPAKSGVYALYYKNELVYVGKAVSELTKSKRTLRARLNEHISKINGRRSITTGDMRCRFLTFGSEWWVVAAEFALIAHYSPSWNASGFGSKTPGKGRPGTERVSRFDELFPKR